jgi:formylglycine-generating enzyme required for sulfatase activity
MNATCPAPDTLEAYLLGADDSEGIEAHLDECPDCQAKLDAMDAVVNRPFAALRQSDAIAGDWLQPAFQHLVARAKAIPHLGSEPVEEPERLPRQVGAYLLLELIAVSGMGRVYKAQHMHLKKTVAVKLIAPGLVRSAAVRQRFRHEMEAVGALHSPHIVTAFDAGEADGVDFLAMEFIEGRDLHALVRERGKLPVADAIDCTRQAARGLAVAHAAGIVHRDVKPRNLLLDKHGTVKVLDLGLALFTARQSDRRGAPDGGGMGTASFMAPEQELDSNVDERADIYGLGCTLYYLLTGQAPDTPIGSLQSIRRDCPRALDALFCRMTARNPKDRPASMLAVAAELERMQKPARRPIGWRGMLAAGVAACVLIAFAIWGQSGPDKEKGKGEEVKVAMPKAGATPKIDMVLIKAGKFKLGASDADPDAKPQELPRSEVKINKAFFLAATEVTQEQYEEVIGKNPSAFSAKGANAARVKDMDTRKHPVESVSWLDAVRFCNKLSERHELPSYYKIKDDVVTIAGGAGYRLPTEAEWEYACRAGTETTWHFGEREEDLDQYAWYAKNSKDHTHPVGTKKANPWGLYDMYGNVPEWCWDRYDPKYYLSMPYSDPPGSGTKNLRSFRGDGWNSRMPRTPAREGLGHAYGAGGSINILGFRVARNAE